MTVTHTDSKLAIGMAPSYPLMRLTVLLLTPLSPQFTAEDRLREVKGTWWASSS